MGLLETIVIFGTPLLLVGLFVVPFCGLALISRMKGIWFMVSRVF